MQTSRPSRYRAAPAALLALCAVAAALHAGAAIAAGPPASNDTSGTSSASNDGAPVVAHPDPWVPPAKRQRASEPGAAGPALQHQIWEKMRQRFKEADLDANGSLSVDEARRAGMGFVVKHFDQIDRSHSGQVTFDDLQAFLAQRRAAARARREAASR
ncbi:EF-hand domain-containing protein [Duganella sp. LX20W]|uniref:EF-hand domain-containing protein n=1 Tax=Rugamonas brunnea TaxID=2758569 RepID=A0A7W2EQD2_9BURK|nr:EF-hand domain-containing protein [Rugamonas brunnea]MBA5636590.1 EF-hand domain-containing protein [Rugamonas brunnea]